MRTGKKHEPVTVQAKGEYKTSNVVSIFKAVASKKRGTSPPPIQCKAVLKGRGFKPKFLMNKKERQERLESVKEELRDLRETLKHSNLSEEQWRILDQKEDKLIAERLRLSLDLD
jgi:hypothetical protein